MISCLATRRHPTQDGSEPRSPLRKMRLESIAHDGIGANPITGEITATMPPGARPGYSRAGSRSSAMLFMQ